jgi:5-amino-6-(5-phosphoribosylamino)uracil reductase
VWRLAPGAELDALDAVAAARPAPPGRPWVLANMIASADGAATAGGRSGGLAGPADKALFRALRSVPDVILVGADTVRIEGYGPARPAEEVRRQRRTRGQAPVPPIAVVSRGLAFDWGAPFFTEATARPILITGAGADPERLAAAAAVADVVEAGADGVDLALALAMLGERGAGIVLTEGGPGLLGQLVADDLLDELFLTIAPKLAGGEAMRIAHGRAPERLRQLRLAQALEADGELFLRYLRA